MKVNFNGCPVEAMFRAPRDNCACEYIRTIYAIRDAIAKYNMKTQWWTNENPKTIHYVVVWSLYGDTCRVKCWNMQEEWNIDIIE